MLRELVLDEAVSTNDRARELASEGAPHGSWVQARKQTGGRGRLGRSWVSLEGNLFFSMVVRIRDRSLWSWIPLAAGVAAARAIDTLIAGEAVLLKWPNDLRARGAKLGGILCEGSLEGGFVIVGIGINCAQAPSPVDQPAICLSELAGRELGADLLRPVLVTALWRVFAELQEQGAAPMAAEYQRRAAYREGAQVSWGERDQRTGKVVGLGAHGELRVELEDGSVTGLFAEDVADAASRIREAPTASDESPA